MHYYKYIDEQGNIIQLEATTRVIDTKKYKNIIEITKEEYDEIIESLTPPEDKQEPQDAGE